MKVTITLTVPDDVPSYTVKEKAQWLARELCEHSDELTEIARTPDDSGAEIHVDRVMDECARSVEVRIDE